VCGVIVLLKLFGQALCGAIILLKAFRTASFYIEPKLIDIGEANQEYAPPFDN